jgi:hypothetical protein
MSLPITTLLVIFQPRFSPFINSAWMEDPNSPFGAGALKPIFESNFAIPLWPLTLIFALYDFFPAINVWEHDT